MARSEEGVREVSPGVWEVSASRGYRPDGSQRRVRRRVRGTLADAREERRRLLAELGASPCAGRTELVRDFWPQFEARCAAKGLTRATMVDYEKQWRLRIEPEFGGLRWAEVTFPRVQAWIYTLSPGTSRHAVRCLKRMLNCAVDAELVDRNVLDHRRLDYPVARPADPFAPVASIWGAHEVSEAARRLRGDRIEALYLATVGAGLRVEEGLALMWERMRPESLSYIGGGDGWMLHCAVTVVWTEQDGYKAPKNRFSARVAPIAEPFASRLLELQEQGPRCFVWPLYPGAARKHWKALFSPGGALAGMPPCNLKDLRGVHETIMQGAGVLDTVNARLHGRTNVQTGYSHYLKPDAALDDAAKAFGRMVAL